MKLLAFSLLFYASPLFANTDVFNDDDAARAERFSTSKFEVINAVSPVIRKLGFARAYKFNSNAKPEAEVFWTGIDTIGVEWSAPLPADGLDVFRTQFEKLLTLASNETPLGHTPDYGFLIVGDAGSFLLTYSNSYSNFRILTVDALGWPKNITFNTENAARLDILSWVKRADERAEDLTTAESVGSGRQKSDSPREAPAPR